VSTSARSIPRRAGASPNPAVEPAVVPGGLTRHFAASAAVIVTVALGLRLLRLGTNSFWIDEINVASFVKSGHLLSDLRDRGGPYEPPLHYLTVLAALQLPFGDRHSETSGQPVRPAGYT